ncbi:zinc finger, CCHC-type containing protein [Tanacetum coccineum]
MKEKDVEDVVEEQILTIKLRAEDSSKKLMKYKLKITNSVFDLLRKLFSRHFEEFNHLKAREVNIKKQQSLDQSELQKDKAMECGVFDYLHPVLGSPRSNNQSKLFCDNQCCCYETHGFKLFKLEKFEGVDFRRWQNKMYFLLSSMSVVYVLTTPMPEDGGENPTVKQVRKRAKWDNDDYDTLEAKYMAEDASSKNFLVSKFTNYKMTDSRPVLEQYNELLDFKHTLKHLKEELTLIELGSHQHIEESLRAHNNDKPKGNNVVGPSIDNMVEHNNSSRYNDNKGKRKHHNTKVDPSKKPKVTCWKCGKPGHLKKDCKVSNVGNKANGSGIKGSGDGSSNSLKGQNMFNKSVQIYYVTYVSEAYFMQDDDVAW